jgi:hypothetical protein
MGFESYWINTLPQPGGDYVMHVETCRYLPDLVSRTPLGLHMRAADAMTLAELLLGRTVPCPLCVREAVVERPLSSPPPAKVRPHPPRPTTTRSLSARLSQPNRRRRNSKGTRQKGA